MASSSGVSTVERGCLGPVPLVLNRGALLPLGDRLRVDPVALGQHPQARLTMLDRATHCRRRAGAPMQNLAHSASFHSGEKSAPSKPGTKHETSAAPPAPGVVSRRALATAPRAELAAAGIRDSDVMRFRGP